MTPETIAYAKDRIAYWQDRLRLGDWVIQLSTVPAESDSRANVDIHALIRNAVIRFDPDVPWDQVEREVVHELLHVRFALAEHALGILKAETPKRTDDAFEVLWDMAAEAAHEALCDALGVAPRRYWPRPDVPELWVELA